MESSTHITKYCTDIQNRSKFRYLKGISPRFRSYIKNTLIIWIARRNGARIGDCVTMPYSLAKRANSNLEIGNHVNIQTDLIDIRCKVTIGNYVIIGSGVEIITLSHNIDSVDWEHKPYGIVIEDYVWLAIRAFVLSSCQQIGYGADCATGSALASIVDAMSVMVGNPVVFLRKREAAHTDLCVESMLGNDYLAYTNTRKQLKG